MNILWYRITWLLMWKIRLMSHFTISDYAGSYFNSSELGKLVDKINWIIYNIVTYYVRWVKTSWTDSKYTLFINLVCCIGSRYHLIIVRNGDGLIKKYRPMVISCVLRTAGSHYYIPRYLNEYCNTNFLFF